MDKEDKKELDKAFKKRQELETNKRLSAGYLQLSLFPVETEPFYSQGLIEKYAFFLPNRTQKKSAIVYKSDKIKVTMGSVEGESFGVLKTTHKDLLYAILRIWAQHQWRVFKADDGVYYGRVETTQYELIRTMYGRKPSKKDYKGLKKGLLKLRNVPFIIETHDGLNTNLHLLDDVKWVESEDKRIDTVKIFLSAYLTRHYYQKSDLKLLSMKTYRSLRSDIAKTIYPIIDRMLSMNGKTHYHKNVRTLCEETGMNKYRYNSEFRKKWKRALNELSNINLSNETKVSVYLKENDDGDLIFHAEKSTAQRVHS